MAASSLPTTTSKSRSIRCSRQRSVWSCLYTYMICVVLLILLICSLFAVTVDAQEVIDNSTKTNTNTTGTTSTTLVEDLDNNGNDTVEVEEAAEQLAVNVTFADTLKVILFLCTAWALSNLSRRLGFPGLVGEICSGFLLGPPLLDFCPFPEAMVLVGNFGLVGLILESGIQIDIQQLKETGIRCVAMAATGTLLGLGTGVAVSFNQGMSTAIAIGAAFAPSSLGVAGSVLTRKKVIHNPNGQLVVAASVVDDILGLILLSLMQVLVQDNPKPFDYILPFLSSFGFLITLGYIGINWIPFLIQEKLLPRFQQKHHENVQFGAMFFLAIIYLPLLNYTRASYLTGAFLAGLSVSQIPGIQKAYQHKMQEIKVWLMRIFFAATIGFQVPIKRFQRVGVLKYGFLFLIPMLAKMPLGIFVPKYRKDRSRPEDFPYDPYHRSVAVIVLSMLCRGEFNFLVASVGLSEGLLSPDLYSAVVFAILTSSIFVPVILSKVLDYYQRLNREYMAGSHPAKQMGNNAVETAPLYITVEANTHNKWSLQENFQRAVENAGLIIIDHRSYRQGDDIQTRIFAQDQIARVRIDECATETKIIRYHNNTTAEDGQGGHTSNNHDEETPKEEPIETRLNEIREALAGCLSPEEDPSKYYIQVLECQINPSVTAASTNSSGSTDNNIDNGTTTTSRRHKKTYSFSDIAPSIFEELQDDIANLHHENEQALNPLNSANTNHHSSPNQNKRSEEDVSPSPDTQEDDTDQS